MYIEITDPLALLDAVRRARAQLVIRVSRIRSCRTCAAELKEQEEALKVLRDFESQLKGELS